MTTDLLSNLLTQIRNAAKIKKPYVEVPYRENNYKILKLLENQGFLTGVTSLRLNYLFKQFFKVSSTKTFKKRFSAGSFFDHESLFRKKKFEKNKHRPLNLQDLLFVTSTPQLSKPSPSLITSSEQDVLNQNIVKSQVQGINHGSDSVKADSQLDKSKSLPALTNREEKVNIFSKKNALALSTFGSSNSRSSSKVWENLPKSVEEVFPSITKLQVGTWKFNKKSFFGKTLLNFYYLNAERNLYKHDYENDFSKQKKAKKSILIALKFTKGQHHSVIHHLKRISKPSLRRYSSHPIPKVLNGLGTAIISTSSGIMTDQDARFKKLGGEILAEIW